MTRKKILSAILVSVSALALVSCGGNQPAPSDEVVLHRGNNAEPLSLDPHKASGTWENNIIGDMFIGLFTQDPEAHPIPGMAESWEVSEDSLVWMAAASRGEAPPESIGVIAVDDHTLEIHLENPAPYLPGLLTHYTSFPLPQHIVEEFGDEWVRPENIEVNGPYKLIDWRTNNFVHLSRNPLFFDNDNSCIDEVYFYPTVDNSAAGRRVRNGELDLNMEFPGQQMEFLRREIPDYVRVHPYMGTVYFSLNTTLPQFSDASVRNALGMAIDRDFIANEILRAGQLPAYSLVPPGVDNYPGGVEASWADTPVEERRATARDLLMAAGYGPDNPFRFEYTYRATADNPRVAPVVQNDWSAIADWVQPELIVNDTQIHYDNLRASDFQVADGGWIADYNDPYNFLFLGEFRSVPMNYSRYNNPEYDALVENANREQDLEVRGDMLAQAEQMLIDDMPIIPLVFYVNKNLVSPRVTGWVDNLSDLHRTRYLCFADLDRDAAASE